MRRLLLFVVFWVGLSTFLVYEGSVELSRGWGLGRRDRYQVPEDFEGFDNVSGTSDGCYIVPNVVHFVRLDQREFTFVDAVCVLAAFKNQNPDQILFHTNLPSFRGKYWKVLRSTPRLNEKMKLKYLRVPSHVFGQPLSRRWRKFHGGDLARLQVLMKYGGIFLDNDSYIVQPLDEFRRFELALGWKAGGNISNQVIVAHRNARFLREWLMTYKDNYNSKSWFYNAGIRPTQVVLSSRPQLVHRVSRRLAEYNGIARQLYISKSGEWREHYAIHLFINHQSTLVGRNLSSEAPYPVVFNEVNIMKYDVNFKAMAMDVYPNSSQTPVVGGHRKR